MTADPCGICTKAVHNNHKAIKCDICDFWIHIKCNNLDKNDYAHYQDVKNADEIFICINCISENMPFSKLNNTEFYVLNKKGLINSEENHVDFVPSDFQQKIFDKLNAAINNNAFDLDTEDENADNMMTAVDCQYYTFDDFCSLNFTSTRTFSILHYNIHSMQRHIDEFRMNLKMLDFYFDVICISESKLLKDIDPNIDISIDGYQVPISTPTEATKGGVLIYVKNGIDFKLRKDLQLYKSKELESLVPRRSWDRTYEFTLVFY